MAPSPIDSDVSTVKLGGTLTIPRLGFGAMQLAGRPNGPAVDQATAVAVARGAVELGVRHLDTAAFYVHGSNREQHAGLVDECAGAGIAFMPFFALGGGRSTLVSENLHQVAKGHGATAFQVAILLGDPLSNRFSSGCSCFGQLRRRNGTETPASHPGRRP